MPQTQFDNIDSYNDGFMQIYNYTQFYHGLKDWKYPKKGFHF